jgi:hypothetical protein
VDGKFDSKMPGAHLPLDAHRFDRYSLALKPPSFTATARQRREEFKNVTEYYGHDRKIPVPPAESSRAPSRNLISTCFDP